MIRSFTIRFYDFLQNETLCPAKLANELGDILWPQIMVLKDGNLAFRSIYFFQDLSHQDQIRFFTPSLQGAKKSVDCGAERA